MIDYAEASKTYDNSRACDERTIALMASRGAFRPRAGRRARVLDFGCGTGNYLERISRLYECELSGLEPSAAMLERARAKNPEARIEEGDHARNPFDQGYFDFAYMTDVIHHVPDLNLLFELLASRLAPGGRVCVATESWAQIGRRWYNAYFPSLAAIERSRYPDIGRIEQAARMAGLGCDGVDIKDNPGPHLVDARFIRLVQEKGYSMFRLLPEPEYESGLSALRRDEGRAFSSPGAGESLAWFEKGGEL
jgi:Methylase involved in ubiquinone/menaquinone biosynthesis